uniref:DEAD/DEAH box helicase n=1 Tax=Fervidicoccus fontis TaxID=683846 RepID=A0A7J3ZKR1_9CREN
MTARVKIDEVPGCFKLLDPRLVSELKKHGITKPTPIQEKSIPHILAGADVIISSPTGTGKTEAAVLPIFSLMLREVDKVGRVERPLMVYITPLRALNRDIYCRLQEISCNIGLKAMVRHGDSTSKERREFLREPPTWFITTPESFTLMLSHEQIRHLLSGIKWVVLDEVHELLGSERGSATEVSLRRLESLTGRYQFVGLSATIPDKVLFKKFYPCRRDCRIVEEDFGRESFYVVVSSGVAGLKSPGAHLSWSVSFLKGLLASFDSLILFTNTRDMAEALGYHVRNSGLELFEVHHGSLSPAVRKSVEERFKQGRIRGVIATSSLELGIDVGTVDVVVQYGSPRQALRLVQRAGRSGHRLGALSRGIVIAEPNLDDIVESAVIARRALRGLLEDVKPHERPIDVLAHQIVGMILAGEARTEEELLRALNPTFTFKGLDANTLREVVEYACQSKMLFRDSDGSLRPSRRSRTFFFTTTMIPDTKRIPVFSVQGERIGFLDEDFVYARLHEESTFLLAGREWRVVAIDFEAERVVVEECIERRGLPPLWEGDLIPVDRLVAREACALIKRLGSGEPLTRILKHYPVLSRGAIEILSKIVEEARKEGYIPPGPNYVLIEEDHRENIAVAYTCLGSRGNDALAILISGYINSRYGKAAETYSDPYRVFLKPVVSGESAAEVLERVLYKLSSLGESDVLAELEDSIKRTGLFFWKVSQVARKMGAVSGKASPSEVRKLLRYLAETLVGKEALRETFHEKVDLSSLLDFLRDLRSGRLKIVRQTKPGFSPYTTHGGKLTRYVTSLSTGIPTELALEIFERKILEKTVLLKCVVCGYERIVKIKELDDVVMCAKCCSRALAPIPPGNLEFVNAIRKYFDKRDSRLKDKEREYVDDAIKRANLVLSHGKVAVIALSPYGVGPKAASRAISRLKLGWSEFLRALYEEERNFLRTRRYWD